MELAPIPKARKGKLICSLILPILTWCAAIAVSAEATLNDCVLPYTRLLLAVC